MAHVEKRDKVVRVSGCCDCNRLFAFRHSSIDNSFVVSLCRVQVSNLTLINFTLYVFGPMGEDELTMVRATSERCSSRHWLMPAWVLHSLLTAGVAACFVETLDFASD